MLDLILSISFLKTPIYWPISMTAFALSGIAFWYGSYCKSEGPASQNRNFLIIFLSVFYLSHWFLVIPWVAIKMSILPKKILWRKTIHTGI